MRSRRSPRETPCDTNTKSKAAMMPLYENRRSNPISRKTLDLDDPLVAGVRHQLSALLEDKKFSLKTLQQISDVAHAAQAMLGYVHTSGLTVDENGLPPTGDSMDDETFGATAMRGFMGTLGELNKPGPDRLIDAIVKARNNGLSDLADDLEAQLRATFGPSSRRPTSLHVDEEIVVTPTQNQLPAPEPPVSDPIDPVGAPWVPSSIDGVAP